MELFHYCIVTGFCVMKDELAGFQVASKAICPLEASSDTVTETLELLVVSV